MIDKIRNIGKTKIYIAFVILIGLVILLLPLRSPNVSINFETENVSDGTTVSLDFFSQSAYDQHYTVDAVVVDNSVKVRLNPEFYELDTISLLQNNTPVSIVGLQVFSGEFSNSDYIVASAKGDLDSEQAIKVIEKGIHNPWRIKLFATLACVVAIILVVLFGIISKKCSSFQAWMFVVLWASFFFFMVLNSWKYDDVRQSVENNQIDQTVYIKNDDTVVKQVLTLQSNRFDAFEIYGFTYEDSCDGNVLITLRKSATNQVIQKEAYAASDFIGGATKEIELDHLINDYGSDYEIEISCLNTTENFEFQLGLSNSDTYSYGYCLIDDVQQDGDLCFGLKFIRLYNVLLAQLSIIFLGVMLSLAILTLPNSKFVKRIIGVIYFGVFGYFLVQMVFCAKYVDGTPDEIEHIGYVAYLEATDCVLPEFEKMYAPKSVEKRERTYSFCFGENNLNYLGHPPLYYNLMRLSKSVHIAEDGRIIVNVLRMKLASILISCVGLLLMFWIGFTRIKAGPLVHLLYAFICTSVPAMVFCTSGVTNDALTVVTVPLFFLGIIRYEEGKKNWLTYTIIATGVTTSLLTKLTAGLIVVFASICVFGCSIIKKNWKDFISKEFFLSIPIYTIALLYYLRNIYLYHSIQPGIFLLDQESARQTGLYTQFADRTILNMADYFVYYFTQFMASWTGPSILLKDTQEVVSVETIALILLWLVPAILLLKYFRKKIAYIVSSMSMYIGIVLTCLMQAKSAYSEFLKRGYLGGFQSRYYICAIVAIAFAFAMLSNFIFDNIRQSETYGIILHRIFIIVITIFISLLAYENFIFFLLKFQKYLFWG